MQIQAISHDCMLLVLNNLNLKDLFKAGIVCKQWKQLTDHLLLQIANNILCNVKPIDKSQTSLWKQRIQAQHKFDKAHIKVSNFQKCNRSISSLANFGNLILTATYDGYLQAWDAKNLKFIKENKFEIGKIQWSISIKDKLITINHINSRTAIFQIDNNNELFTITEISSIWHLPSQKPKTIQFEFPYFSEKLDSDILKVASILITPDKRKVILEENISKKVHKEFSLDQFKDIPVDEKINCGTLALERVITGSSNGIVRIWNVVNGTCIRCIKTKDVYSILKIAAISDFAIVVIKNTGNLQLMDFSHSKVSNSVSSFFHSIREKIKKKTITFSND